MHCADWCNGWMRKTSLMPCWKDWLLLNTGIPASRVDTVSFGESKPAVQGHDEAAWKWNRRADFRVMR